MNFIDKFIKQLGGNVHEKIDDRVREITLARIFYIYFYLIFTSVGIYIVSKILGDNFFGFEFSELTFIFLITLYTIYLFLGFALFNAPWKSGYLLMVWLVLLLGIFIVLIWGVLHAHGLALILLATQLTFYLSNRNQRVTILLLIFLSLISITYLQVNELLPYGHQQAGIYYNLLDVVLVLSYVVMSILTAKIHTDTRETLVVQLKRLYREIQKQNLKLKRNLIIEINRRLKLEKSIVDLRNTRAIEIEYQNTLDLVSTNNEELKVKAKDSVNGKSTIHTLANEFQKLIMDIYNAELSREERNKIHNKIVNINREFDTYRSGGQIPVIEPLKRQQDKSPKQLFNELTPVKHIKKLPVEPLNHYGDIKTSSLIRAIGNDIDLKVRFVAPAKEPYINTSLHSLRTVFYNLLINAKQADANEVLVTIKKLRGSTPALLEIRIQDNGRGITLGRYKEVLKALESAKTSFNGNSQGYMGAGLATAKEITHKQLGGTLTIKRARATGNFAATLRIPINRAVNS